MLLPYATDRPPRNPPLATVALVLIQFALFAAVALTVAVRGPDAPVVWFANLSLVPESIRWYAPFTYSFLHENIFHLSANMLFLWVFGGSLEEAIGWKRFLGLYAAAAVAAGLFQCGMAAAVWESARSTPIIGASGAVAALVGAFAVRFYRARIRFIGLPFRVPALLLAAGVTIGEIAVAVFQLWNPATSTAGQTAAHWAHAGGFVIGVLWAQLFRFMQAGRREYLVTDAAIEMERGSPLAAVRRWEAVLAEHPDDAEAEAELGRAWAIVGEKDQSAEHYRRAISALLGAGDKAAAAARFAELRELQPGASLPAAEMFSLASYLEESGRAEESLAAHDALAAAHPDSPEAELSRLRCASLLLRRLDRPGEAVSRLEQFLADYPDSHWRHFAEDSLRAARARTG